MKLCQRCGCEKPEDEFRPMSRNGKNKNYLRSYCRPCDSEYERVARRDYRKNWQLKKAYGITLDEYREMFDRQNGLCAICELPEADSTNGVAHLLAVDHDHETGKVRALLCKKCNTAIGLLGHDLNLLRTAVQYLELFA